ncbi:MAG: sugar phosphate isomerase/epimerase [Pirellulales bacterium]|nr:sugar phosphate isomerase/epimerase [Pirellulales bacterium]
MRVKNASQQSDYIGSRRKFIQAASALVALGGGGMSLFGAIPETGAVGKSLADRLGIASYTFRLFNLDKTIAMTRRLGIKNLCLKSCHLPLDAKPEKLEATAAKVKQKGLNLYGGGVISMKKPAEVDQAFEYAKHAGLKILLIMPTVAMLPLIEKKVKQYDVKTAIHNHGPGDRNFPTPGSAYEKIKDLDPRMGLCVDIGHTVRYGDDLYAALEKCRDRIYDIHLKDVTSATAKGQTTILGRGIIDFARFFRILQKINFRGVLGLEYESEGRDPLPSVAQTVGYARGMLAVLEKNG